MRRLLAATVAAISAAGALAACGSTSHQASVALNRLSHPSTANKPVASHDVIVPVKTACPANHATMGCSVQPSPLAKAVDVPGVSRPAGPTFPDVSSWQGCHINWSEAKPHVWGAVAKLGEYSIDPCAAYNVSQFRALHMRWTVYLFGRPLGCSAEVQSAESWLAQVGGPSTTGPVLVYDNEEPGLAGYALCIDRAIFAKYHRHITVYTSAGTWSGGSAGSLDEWAASYGPSSPPSCIWGCHVSAWQYTDGQFGFPTYIPGIGSGDVSIAYHFFTAAPKPKPPPPAAPRCFGKGWQHGQHCNQIRAQALHLGYHVKQETQYAAVSRHNLTAIEARLAVELKHLAGYRAQLCRLLAGSPLACR